ncbi:MAG: transcription termination/antitermination protein NusA, partial [Oscillospiraceae bacterium]|nr:transcription termination/antitermination protein NusA [Oscillospiraceae bacterium]
MNAEFFAAVADIEKEKGIPKEYMYEKITQALLAAFRKDNVEYEGNVEVLLDETAKKIQLVEYKVVVEDVYEPYCEVTLPVAKKVVRGAKLGDTIAIPVETKDFGRIAAQAAKQVIIQGIREAERGMVYDEFTSK